MTVAEGERSGSAGIPPTLQPLDDPRVTQALEEYVAGIEAGHQLDRHAFQARHPEIAAALAECLDGLEFVHKAVPEMDDPNQPATGSASAPLAVESEGPLGDYRLIREIGRAAWASSTRRCKSRSAAR